MIEEIQQLALMNALLVNWDAIQIRLEPISPALAKRLTEIAQRLARETASDELDSIVRELLRVTQDTAAQPYVSELLERSKLIDKEPGAPARPIENAHAAARTAEARQQIRTRAVKTGDSLAELLHRSVAQSPGIMQVPVFFATNRKSGTQPSCPFLGELGDGISYGLVSVSIPGATHMVGRIETPRWWNHFPGSNGPDRFLTLGSLRLMPKPAFASQLEITLQEAEAKDLLIFLHGYNVTFEEAALRAAQFAYDTKFPGVVVLFSWPSLGALSRYTADEDRSAASADSLAEFCKGLEGGPWRRVHVLAHSMGNRVMLLGFADNSRPDLPFGEFVFVAADVYVPIFGEKFPKIQRAGKLNATSYASKRDNALLISDFLHKGDRVGLIRTTPYVTDDLETIDATAVDRGFLGHSYFADQRSLLTDLSLLLNSELPARNRGLASEGKYWAFVQ